MSTAMRAGGSPHRPPGADRRAPATEIPHPSLQLQDRPASESAATMPTALREHYYRKPVAAGPRPEGLAVILGADNLTWPTPLAGRCVGWLQTAVRRSLWGTPGAASVPERPQAVSGSNPCQCKGTHHERRR